MTDVFTAEESRALHPYVSNTERPVFVVENLPEEVVAVLFAYYSRSRDSLRRNLLKLLTDKDLDMTGRVVAKEGVEGGVAESDDQKLASARERAKQFHEKWVVGYGHQSVAEHAVAHIAVEDVSIIASKIIEDNRLASYTEKSTRYVVFDPEKYYKAPELDRTPYAAGYHDAVRAMMETYAELTPLAIEEIKKRAPRQAGQTETGYNTACKAKACDVLRYVLPAATFTNIGVTANGRALEHMITKLLSHPLAEAQQLGAAIKREAETIIPTLLKYAAENSFIAETNRQMSRLAADLMSASEAFQMVQEKTASASPEKSETNRATIVHYDADAEDKLVAAILYEYAHESAATVNEVARRLRREEKERVIDEYLARRGKWDEPLRALEHITYTFDILVDYGAFRDIQRHRMATQTTQLLTDAHGFETPPEIHEYGYTARFNELMEQGSAAFQSLVQEFPYEAQYVLPLAYRKRALFTWNLRSLHHFISLRSAKQGHASYRDIAQQVYHEIRRVHPLLARYIRVDLQDYALARA